MATLDRSTTGQISPRSSSWTCTLSYLSGDNHRWDSAAYRTAQLLLESKNGVHKHFLYLGNVTHKSGHAWPFGYTLGVGKASAAHMIEVGAKAYGKNGGAM